MTDTWKTYTQQQRTVAGRAFDSLSTLDEIAAAHRSREAGESRGGFADVYAYVNEPGRPMSARLSEALKADARLHDDLLRLLAKTASYRCVRSAAAGTKVLESRHGEGFTIRLRPSRAEPSQVYVVIELLDRAAESPKSLFVAEQPDGLLKYALPETRGGTVQILAETESDLIRALRNPGSEVFLR